MGRLVDDAVVVLESIHRHQRMGMSRLAAPRSRAPTPSRCPCSPRRSRRWRCSCRSLLLAGLAKKLFAPLALTVAVAMIASYFVSMCGHARWRAGTSSATPSTAASARPSRRSSIASPTRYCRGAARACCRIRCDDHRAPRSLLVVASGVGRGAPAEHVLPRDRRVDGARSTSASRPGISLDRRRHAAQRDGQDALATSCPRATVEMVLANVGTPQNARSAIISPNVGPAHGLHPPRLRRPRAAQALAAARSPTRAREILDPRVPRRRDPAVAGRPRRQRLRQRLHRAARRRGPRRQARRARRRRPRPSPRWRAPSPACATCASRSRSTTRRSASRPIARRRASWASPRATRRRPRSTPRSATSTRRACGSTRSNGQSYYVVTSYDGAQGRRHERARASSPCASARRAGRSPSAPTPRSGAALGPIAVERNQLQRAAHVLMQTEGRDIGSVAEDLERALQQRPAHPQPSSSTSWVRSSSCARPSPGWASPSAWP